MIDWSLEVGWDEQHGGLVYFLDYKGFFHVPRALWLADGSGLALAHAGWRGSLANIA